MEKQLSLVSDEVDESMNVRSGCQRVDDRCDRHPFECTGHTKSTAGDAAARRDCSWSSNRELDHLGVENSLCCVDIVAFEKEGVGAKTQTQSLSCLQRVSKSPEDGAFRKINRHR